MSKATLLLLLAILPSHAAPVDDRVDVMHLNHFYDGEGRLVFDQLIFEDWGNPNCLPWRHSVVAWRLVKNPAQIPMRSVGGDYRAIWFDGEVLRDVRAGSFRESWGQYDPEVLDRDVLPRELRRELRQPGQQPRQQQVGH